MTRLWTAIYKTVTGMQRGKNYDRSSGDPTSRPYNFVLGHVVLLVDDFDPQFAE